MVRLSTLEEKVMNTLWSLDKAFPKEILAHLPQPTPAYNTVLSTIRRLESEGHIGFDKYGRSHQYYPILNREAYTSSLLKKVCRDLLGGSVTALASHFAQSEEVDIKALEEALAKLREKTNHDH